MDLVINASLLVLAGGGMLANAVTHLASRTQLEELLDRRKAGSLTRAFAKPFLEHGPATALCCSVLRTLFVGLYLAWGIHAWGTGHNGVDIPLSMLMVYLMAPLLLLALPIFVLSRLRTEGALLALSRPLYPFMLLLMPLGRLIVHAEESLEAAFSPPEEEEDEDREDILAVVSDGHHEGVVEEQEREMIVNIFDLKNTDVSDIMTPRTDVCAIANDTTVPEAIRVALEKGYSRIPVYEETRDNIEGVFYIKDVLDLWGKPAEEVPALATLLRPPIFVPESKSVAELMDELQQKKMHMAVVLDEYGGTAGVVTIEDVVEEIVGEIHDEYDEPEEESLTKIGPEAWELEARTHVHDMNETIGDRVLPENEDFETVGGFVLDQLGHVPVPGETFLWQEHRFTVLASDERKIDRVRIEHVSEEEADAEASSNGHRAAGA